MVQNAAARNDIVIIVMLETLKKQVKTLIKFSENLNRAKKNRTKTNSLKTAFQDELFSFVNFLGSFERL